MKAEEIPAGEPLEIERKFLIRRPPEEQLSGAAVRRVEIRQIYLLSRTRRESRRIRESRWEGETHYHYNEKRRLSNMTRVEREQEISGEEFARLSLEADPHRQEIRKTRWLIPHGELMLEVDVFPFWEDRAFCEAELKDENQPVTLPEWMELVREVTDDPRYTNNALARRIPEEELPPRC